MGGCISYHDLITNMHESLIETHKISLENLRALEKLKEELDLQTDMISKQLTQLPQFMTDSIPSQSHPQSQHLLDVPYESPSTSSRVTICATGLEMYDEYNNHYKGINSFVTDGIRKIKSQQDMNIKTVETIASPLSPWHVTSPINNNLP